jgi:rfaE bifunctional protein nucleotidyltransferase chain/domain/rfaE bifunctional protein kinase chain/domain
MTAPLVVIGDVMLDIDLVGRCERLSPEAPVPVLSDLEEHRRPGGAALAALLAARCSAGGPNPRRVVLIAPIADDDAAHTVAAMLGEQVELIAVAWRGRTPVKTRIRIGDHPVARLDAGGDSGPLGRVPDRAKQIMSTAAAVLVCDYGRGATDDPELRAAIAEAAGRVPVVWDPHPKASPPVAGCALVTPNEAELSAFAQAIGQRPSGPGGTWRGVGARAMASRWKARAVAVTLGAHGAMVCLGDNAPLMVRGAELRAVDTCGAGDSFAAAAARALAQGRLPSEAVAVAVAEANRFVEAGAASAVRAGRVDQAPRPAGGAAELVRRVHTSGGVVVATGGCFDLLHAGHIAALEAARALGDCLIVCLNSDASVRRLKGPERPLQPQGDRARVLRALTCVDEVVIFDADTPAEVLRQIRPDVWVKGGDYNGADLPEADVLAEWGGEAVIVPYLKGRSTSELVELAAGVGKPTSR